MKYEELDTIGKTMAVLTKQGMVNDIDVFDEKGVYDADATINAYEEGIATEAKYRPFLDKYYDLTYSRWKHVTHPGLQKNYDIDRIISGRKTTEDKYVNDKNYDRIFIEKIQNSHIGSLGWIYVCRADYLLYCLCTEERIRILTFDMRLLKEWYKENKHYPEYIAKKYDTAPIGYLVLIKDFPKNILLEDALFYI